MKSLTASASKRGHFPFEAVDMLHSAALGAAESRKYY
jgi:hypothetical protein